MRRATSRSIASSSDCRLAPEKETDASKRWNQKGQTSTYPTATGCGRRRIPSTWIWFRPICPKCGEGRIGGGQLRVPSDLGRVGRRGGSAFIKADAVRNSYIGSGAHSQRRRWYFHPGHMIVAAGGDSGYKVGEPAGFPSVVAVSGPFLQKSSGGRVRLKAPGRAPEAAACAPARSRHGKPTTPVPGAR